MSTALESQSRDGVLAARVAGEPVESATHAIPVSADGHAAAANDAATWVEGFDKLERSFYYYNTQTGETTRDRPPAGTAFAPYIEHTAAASRRTSQALAEPDWREGFDKLEQSYYYFNTKTGETRAEKPEGAACVPYRRLSLADAASADAASAAAASAAPRPRSGTRLPVTTALGEWSAAELASAVRATGARPEFAAIANAIERVALTGARVVTECEGVGETVDTLAEVLGEELPGTVKVRLSELIRALRTDPDAEAEARGHGLA